MKLDLSAAQLLILATRNGEKGNIVLVHGVTSRQLSFPFFSSAQIMEAGKNKDEDLKFRETKRLEERREPTKIYAGS